MTMFDTFDRTGSAEFPFSREVVYRALADAVRGLPGMTIEADDPLACRLSLSTGISAFSWGEKVTIGVVESGPRRAVVQVASGAKTILGSATTHGKNRKNVDRIVKATSERLQENGARWQAEADARVGVNESPSSPQVATVEDRLRRLAQLRSEGLISDNDFESRKMEVLRDV